MRYARVISLLLAPLLLVVRAPAQLADWNAVQALRAGTKIHVTLKRGRTFGHCFFESASDNQLVCSQRARFDPRTVVYPRNNIKAVYLTHNGTAIGIGVGAGTGAVIGATRSRCCRGGNAVIDAGAFALMGGFVGMMADPFFHGRAVYRSPNSNNAPQSPSVPTVQNADQPADNIPCLRDGVTLRCVTSETVTPAQAQSDPSSNTGTR